MSPETIENVVLERLVPDLQSQGYDVFVHPNKQIVPSFLGSYVPDLIAVRDDKSLVFEIKRKNSLSETFVEGLAKRFQGQDRWEFRVVWVNPSETQELMASQSRETISGRLNEISRLLESGFVDSAMLVSWAALEAIGRKLMAKEFTRPQSPGRLIQVLAKEGHITPDEADLLRELADVRNRLIHGELSVLARRDQVEAFLKVLSGLTSNFSLAETH